MRVVCLVSGGKGSSSGEQEEGEVGMVTVVVLENGARSTQVEELIERLQQAGAHDLIALGSNRPAKNGPVSNIIISNSVSVGSCLRQAALIARSDTLLIVDARLSPSTEEARILVSEAAKVRSDSMGFATIELGHTDIEFSSEMSVDSFISEMVNGASFPFGAVAMSRKQILDGEEPQGDSTTAALFVYAARHLADHSPIVELTSLKRDALGMAGMIDISRSGRAAALREVVRHANIEEIFPNKPWSTNESESAASSYETLAAYFIKLGDSTSALECLQLSDKLQESPRSLALRAIISRQRGEVLGAVANFVSSLQQYEVRQLNAPQAVVPSTAKEESLNQKLRMGLEALNNKDNERAMEHFASAVFSVDSFYAECGLRD